LSNPALHSSRSCVWFVFRTARTHTHTLSLSPSLPLSLSTYARTLPHTHYHTPTLPPSRSSLPAHTPTPLSHTTLGRVYPDLRWKRSLCPWDLTRSANEWEEIARPHFSNAALLDAVSHIPQILNTDVIRSLPPIDPSMVGQTASLCVLSSDITDTARHSHSPLASAEATLAQMDTQTQSQTDVTERCPTGESVPVTVCVPAPVPTTAVNAARAHTKEADAPTSN
jgi:hypothetical protein